MDNRVDTAQRRTCPGIIEAHLRSFQVLPPEQRERAISQIASTVSPRGTLLVICRGRSPEENEGNMPWPLTRRELDLFQSDGLLQQVQFEDYLDYEEPPARRFCVQYVR